jgi:hypothetical protein
MTVVFMKYIEGVGLRSRTDFLDAVPSGRWTHLSYGPMTTTTYLDFLQGCVEKTLDIKRKIARLSLDQALDSGKFINIMNAIRILDSSFVPPVINKKSTWQRNLLRDIASRTSVEVISACVDENKLTKYSTILQLQ